MQDTGMLRLRRSICSTSARVHTPHTIHDRQRGASGRPGGGGGGTDRRPPDRPRPRFDDAIVWDCSTMNHAAGRRGGSGGVTGPPSFCRASCRLYRWAGGCLRLRRLLMPTSPQKASSKAEHVGAREPTGLQDEQTRVQRPTRGDRDKAAVLTVRHGERLRRPSRYLWQMADGRWLVPSAMEELQLVLLLVE